MVNNNIDQAIAQVELHHNYIDTYGDILEWAEQDKLKIVFSEDETEFNQNVWPGEGFDAEYIAYCRKDFHRHKTDLQRAKMRLREVMKKYNQGWTF